MLDKILYSVHADHQFLETEKKVSGVEVYAFDDGGCQG